MTLTKSVAALLGGAALCLGAPPAAAQKKFDGSVPLMCAAVAVAECGAAGDCRQHRRPEAVNMPVIWRIDVKRMKVHYPELNRESPVRSAEHRNGRLILNGADAEHGWVIIIHEDSGRMSAGVTGHDEGFVLFGQCALP